MTCPSCGTETRPGARFCRICGHHLARVCPNGHPVEPDARFCEECGAPIAGAPAEASLPAGEAPTAERKLVSVLFADLVGFTPLSEARDPEEVRDLLSRYFDAARRLIALYGGTVEKFIGDAVMAVWGTPVAQEDDAERAARAALDLVEAVAALGADLGAPELKARAAVLTGEAAVTIGATGEGMVAGDLVNTASRVQSLASPGTVLAGEATRRATEAAIVYEDAGAHELKGKAEPVHLWRAVRVIGGRAGALRSATLEAPFVGRERELRLVKELFHAAADERRAHLLSVVGMAGIGKSRLSWEFYKYIDGLADVVFWHRGRCLAYGEGVAFWALAEMVRRRAGILEDEDPEEAAAKLRASISEHLPDPEERQWVEPRLAHLLGLEARAAPHREELFSAWRLFFERLSDLHPVVMVFEDLQWADAALLDFIEHLLDWSRNRPLYLLTLSRPEMAERRPGWGTGARATSLFLEPLSPEAMDELVRGLVPGLPGDLVARIRDRAEGVPLYAMETVRMLLDRRLVRQEGERYVVAGEVETLEVPETLQSLIAARLDGLNPEERALLRDATVLGKSFTRDALAAITGMPEEALEPLLASLVRRELVGVETDPRSPERGNYGFLQALVQEVAYQTLTRKERKAKHLAVARFLESSWSDEDEIAPIVAAHYLEAYLVLPGAEDAPEVKATARRALARAGERSASLAANDEAQRYFERAVELADDAAERAELTERAGQMAFTAGRSDVAESLYEQAIRHFESQGQTHPAARVSGRLAEVLWDGGRIAQALDRMEGAFAVLSNDPPDADLAMLASQLARLHFFSSRDIERARERAEFALDVAEAWQLPEILSQALNTKSLIADAMDHREEALALLTHALKVALDHGAHSAALRAYNNLMGYFWWPEDYDRIVEYAERALALARRVGSRDWEWTTLSHLAGARFRLGEWDEALAVASEIPSPAEVPGARRATVWVGPIRPWIAVLRGELDEAERALRTLEELGIVDLQDRADLGAVRARTLRAQGRLQEALSVAEETLALRGDLGWASVTGSFVETAQAHLALGEVEKTEELLESTSGLRPGETPVMLKAQVARLRARLAASRGEDAQGEDGFRAAEGILTGIGNPFALAEVLLEHAEWLAARGRPDEADPLLQEARAIFERLRAAPFLERLAQVEAGRAPAAV